MTELIIFMRNLEGGVATYIRNFLEFRTQGLFHIKLILISEDYSSSINEDKKFNADEIVLFRYSRYENLYYVLKRLSKVVADQNSILWSNERTELAMINLFELPNPIMNVIHGDSNYYYENVSRFQRFVDGYLGTSEWISKRAVQIIKDNKGHSLVRKIFAPVKSIVPKEKRNEGVCKIVFIGRVDEKKGAQHIVGICRQLDELDVHYSINIVGTGELVTSIKKASLNLNGEFIFHGFISNEKVFDLLNESHILLFPSYSEAVGLVVVEAMKAGVVPISSRLLSGIPEILFENETGFTVAIGDEIGFAKKISYLYNNPEKMREMSIACIELANRYFDPKRQTAAIEDYILAIGKSSFSKTFESAKYGHKLDSRYIPNRLSYLIRKLIGFIKSA